MGYLNTVGVGDCLQYLAQIPDNSIDSVVTDSPYGLGEAPDPIVVFQAWCRGEVYEPKGGGFFGKKWDAFVPQPPVWRECRRVLKPGGFLLSFFGTRTYDWGAMSIRFGGFDVLDQVDWLYGTGMPKGGKFDAGEDWEGWKAQLRPGHEPIVVARKPIEGRLSDNVREHGTGAFNVKGAPANAGRWPANVALTCACEGECQPGCAIAELDKQSGFTKSSAGEQRIVRQSSSTALWHGMGAQGNEHVFQGYGDEGGASRFFWSAKAPASERWTYCKQCEQVFTNHKDRFAEHEDHRDQLVTHPTQKPLKLMEWLIRLVTQPGGVVLDPYCGTGTTALAAKRQGFNFVTCDLSPSYAEIARVRLSANASEARDQLASGAHICPGCKTKGEITLIDKDTIASARERGRKVTCMKCLKRFTADTFV